MDKLSKYMFFVTIVSIEYLATTSTHISIVENIWDKFNHFFAFFVLYILLSFAFESMSKILKVILLLLYGIQIEVVQYFLPHRYFSLLDVFADFVGILLGIVGYYFVRKLVFNFYKV